MSMSMVEALEWAADYCARNNIFAAPKNDRGYVESGWKPPTNAEKIDTIRKLATDVVEQQSQVAGSTGAVLLSAQLDSIRAVADRLIVVDGFDSDKKAVVQNLARLSGILRGESN